MGMQISVTANAGGDEPMQDVRLLRNKDAIKKV